MGLQHDIPQQGMKTRLTKSIPSRRSLPMVLQVLALTQRTPVSKASSGSSCETTTSCRAASTRHCPLRAEASTREYRTSWVSYYQLSRLCRGSNPLHAEQG